MILTLVGLCSLTAPVVAKVWHGLYTDTTSYAPGDEVKVHVSSTFERKVIVRIVRLDTDWSEVVRSDVLEVGPQSSYVGSFLEYPDITLAGRTSFTLEGWFYPTLIGGDLTVVAGQIGLSEAAAGIVITRLGMLAAYVSDTPQTVLSRLAIAPASTTLPLACTKLLDCWYHLALTYDANADDGMGVKLYLNGELVAQRSQTGPVASVDAPFRLGARSEAPGDGLTGLLDGRLDSWALWPDALSAREINQRYERGLEEDDPAPNPAEVDLYLGFEDTYPSIADSSNAYHSGRVINHGTPGVAGVFGQGRAFRINHDQIVDAGWDVTTELQIPADTPSGMYAAQVFPSELPPTQQGDPLFVRTFAVRPKPGGPHAPIAVVLPTNTWTVYNSWPGGPYQPKVPSRSRFPGGPTNRGGENTGYFARGDGVSHTRFHGLRRPSFEASPVKPGIGGAEYTVRAPNSMYLMQWLDAQGFAYDVYSDNDFDAGLISASDYRVLMPHSHNEYWSGGMLENLTRFLDAGGSVVAPAGNSFGQLVVNGPDEVVEMHRKAVKLGIADLYSGIDHGIYIGKLKEQAICNGSTSAYYGNPRYRALGVSVHYVHPCGFSYDRMFGGPFCLGQWAASNTNHWLWRGSGLTEYEIFGTGRDAVVSGQNVPTNALGHEADTWVGDMPLPGLAERQVPVILAEGTNLLDYPERINDLLNEINKPEPTCDDIIALRLGDGQPSQGEETIVSNTGNETNDGKAGTILYFPHNRGGHVLVMGASATPWALESDAALSGLLRRGLSCFAYDQGCLVAEADFIPLNVRRGKGLFRIAASAVDPNDSLVSLLAVIRLPDLDRVNIDLERQKKTRIEVDLREGKAKIAGPDPEALLEEIRNYGGLLVEDGQRTKIKLRRNSKYKLEFKRGILNMTSPRVILWVAANGNNGGSDIDTASPDFTP